MAKRFNYLFTLWVGPNPLVVSANLEFHAAVLKDPKLIDKPSYYRLMEQVIGRNIGTSDGSTYWHRMGRNLTPAFHVKMLKHYGKVFEKHAIALWEQFTELCNKNTTFDVQPISRETAMRIIMETTIGIDLQDVNITVLKLQMDSLKTLEQITVYRAKRPWLYPEWIFFKTAKGKIVKEQHAFIEQFATIIIQERKKVREETEEDNTKAIIDILLDVHKRGEMEMKDMLGEITVFMGAGHDTSATAISWTLFLLGADLDLLIPWCIYERSEPWTHSGHLTSVASDGNAWGAA